MLVKSVGSVPPVSVLNVPVSSSLTKGVLLIVEKEGESSVIEIKFKECILSKISFLNLAGATIEVYTDVAELHRSRRD